MPRYSGPRRSLYTSPLPKGAPGTLDETFNGDGKLETSVSAGDDVPRAVVVQPDGKAIAVGYYLSAGGDNDIMLARYLVNGNLDASYGTGGLVLTDFAAGAAEQALAADLAPDGKLVISGFTTGAVARPLIARYNTDGSLDQDFGTLGSLTIAVGDTAKTAEVNAVKVLSDSSIIVGGRLTMPASTNQRGFIGKITSLGVLDTNFGVEAGYTTTDIVNSSNIRALALKTDDNMIYGFGDCTNNSTAVIVRLDSDGEFDTTFGTLGIYKRVLGSSVVGWSGAVAPDYSPVICLQDNPASGIGTTVLKTDLLGVADGGFGTGGRTHRALINAYRGFARTGDGKYMGVGHSTTNPQGFLVCRWTSAGVEDTSFAYPTGLLNIDFQSASDQARACAVSPVDGKLVVAGYSDNGTVANFAIARVNI